MFFFKSPKVIIDCFTDLDYVYNHSTIKQAFKFYPEWWKQMPKEYELDGIKTSTLKRCPGFIDYYKTGFMMPMWSDLTIEILNNGYKWVFSDGLSEIEHHNPKQYDAYINLENYFHGKIISPWVMSCKKDINFLFTHPAWHYQPINSFSILSGVLNFKYSHKTNINIIFDRHKDKYIKFEFGKPLVHLIPLTEKEIIFKHHLVSPNELKVITNPLITFTNGYKNNKRLLEVKEKKCPFNFRGGK
jgi:hypothetical protein